jgi:hypothetical protein
MDGSRSRRGQSFHDEHSNNYAQGTAPPLDCSKEASEKMLASEDSSEAEPQTRARSRSVHANDPQGPPKPNDPQGPPKPVGMTDNNVENKADKIERSSQLNTREVKALKMVGVVCLFLQVRVVSKPFFSLRRV